MPRPRSPSPENLKNEELSQLLDDRGNNSTVDLYVSKDIKTKGVSQGFIGEKGNAKYILKSGEIDFNENIPYNSTSAADKRDLVTEFISSALYERILKDRAPKIGLAEQPDSPSKKHIYLKSKFLEGFEDIDTYKNKNPGQLEIDGFEKVIAACLFMGEIDYHDQNIGIAKGKDGNSYAVKIDHGRTGLGLVRDQDEESIMRSFLENRNYFDYSDIAFKANKFKDAVSEISNVSDDEIDHLIENRVDVLKKTGFKLNAEYAGYGVRLGTKVVHGGNPSDGEFGIEEGPNDNLILSTKGKASIVLESYPDGSLFYITDKGETKDLPKDINLKKQFYVTEDKFVDKILDFTSSIGFTKDEQKIRYNNLEKFYTEKLKARKVIFQEMEKTLDVISKIDGNEKFKKSEWINEIYGKYGPKKDPIIYAIEKKLQIKGKDPIVLAVENNKMIEREDLINWAVQNQQNDVLIYFAKNNIKITDKDPIVWFMENYPDLKQQAIVFSYKENLKINKRVL